MSTASDSEFVTSVTFRAGLDSNVPFRQWRRPDFESQWPRMKTQTRSLFTLDREDVELEVHRVRREVTHPQAVARAGLPGGAGDVARFEASDSQLRAPGNGLAS